MRRLNELTHPKWFLVCILATAARYWLSQVGVVSLFNIVFGAGVNGK
jgi:hypothetical protein